MWLRILCIGYNVRHLLQPAQFRSPVHAGEAAGLHAAAPESHDPAVPGKNSLFQKCPDTEVRLLLHLHTYLL